MTTGLNSLQANAILNQLTAQGTWTAPGLFFVQLHTGDPGVAGTSNVANNAVRHTATFSAAAAGAITTSALVTWVSVSATETYSFVSFWNSGTAGAGTFLASDNLEVARGVTAGDTFTIAAGDIDITLGAVAA
jgi:hypothetical protein